MNREDVVLNIKKMEDIYKLENSNIKYLSIDIVNVNNDVISYLKKHGQKFFYTDCIENKNGYVYVDYNTFLFGEKIISSIISNVPKNLNQLELSKYLYVSLGNIIGYDINSIYEKNEILNLNEVNTINNIWGAISFFKATNQSYCKLYLYLCSIFKIKCEIISVNTRGYLCNRLKIDSNVLVVDLTKDVPFIQSKFRTRYFSNYNDELNIDKKICFIKDCYNEIKLDKELKKIDYNNKNFIFNFLDITQKIIDIDQIKPIELGVIYELLFQKYCPSIAIFINNLYINDIYNNKKHFILISYNDMHYSYNYSKQRFIEIYENDLINNIKNNKIGIYMNENIPIIYKNKEVI